MGHIARLVVTRCGRCYSDPLEGALALLNVEQTATAVRSPAPKGFMAHLPSLERFVDLAGRADYVPVYRELLSDALSPVQAFARLDRGEAAGLFESVIGGEKVGRYSFVASDPFVLLEARGTKVTIRRRGSSGARSVSKGEPSTSQTEWESEQLDVPNPL